MNCCWPCPVTSMLFSLPLLSPFSSIPLPRIWPASQQLGTSFSSHPILSSIPSQLSALRSVVSEVHRFGPPSCPKCADFCASPPRKGNNAVCISSTAKLLLLNDTFPIKPFPDIPYILDGLYQLHVGWIQVLPLASSFRRRILEVAPANLRFPRHLWQPIKNNLFECSIWMVTSWTSFSLSRRKFSFWMFRPFNEKRKNQWIKFKGNSIPCNHSRCPPIPVLTVHCPKTNPEFFLSSALQSDFMGNLNNSLVSIFKNLAFLFFHLDNPGFVFFVQFLQFRILVCLQKFVILKIWTIILF